VGFAVLVLATIALFVLIDSGSHSASDTVRPFLLITVPLWLAVIWIARR
jgi:hypothetical protein